MADYDPEKSGILFKNDKHEEGDNRPWYTGKIQVEGVEYRLAAWVKEGRNGKFLSLKAEVPIQQGEQQPVQRNDGPF